MELNQFIAIDLPALLTLLACAISCALLGSLLVLRRESLLGDSLSHVVLPGIVGAFFLTNSRAGNTVFIGALIAAILASILIHFLKSSAKIEPGAAMGVVFSVFFALGVFALELGAARNVDLDADCLLHGQLESIIWFPEFPLTLSSFAHLPQEVFSTWTVMLISISLVWLLSKELKLASFDPLVAHGLGFRPTLVSFLLIVLSASTVVASFQAVGSILVIAMLICPGAAARFYSDRFHTHILLSVIIAIVSALMGYVLAAFVPIWLGYSSSLSASGMVASTLGVSLGLSAIFAPRYGVLGRLYRKLALRMRVENEDLLAWLYRVEEKAGDTTYSGVNLRSIPKRLKGAKSRIEREGLLEQLGDQIKLSAQGLIRARELIRQHRLWESYLVDQLGLKPDHVHPSAERLEHFRNDLIADQLASAEHPLDPHGREIPKA